MVTLALVSYYFNIYTKCIYLVLIIILSWYSLRGECKVHKIIILITKLALSLLFVLITSCLLYYLDVPILNTIHCDTDDETNNFNNPTNNGEGNNNPINKGESTDDKIN